MLPTAFLSNLGNTIGLADVGFANVQVLEAVFTEKTLKRPKEVDVEKLSNAVTRGFNKGGFSHLQQEMAAGMVTGKKNSFDDTGLLLGDITELVMDDIDDKKDEEINAAEGGEGECPKPDADA
eukprot:2588298-Amphidinium_carterae.2